VTAAGNDGPFSRTLSTPADCRFRPLDRRGRFAGNDRDLSSRGPTADGRIKPDFTAPGVAVCVLTGIDHVGREDGTSFATPLLAGARRS